MVLREVNRHLEPWSLVIILITFLMFVTALFLKGIGHDLLLEGAVFLVSVKLIMMAYKNSVAATKLNGRLNELQSTLLRIEGFVGPGRRLETIQGATPEGSRTGGRNKAPQ